MSRGWRDESSLTPHASVTDALLCFAFCTCDDPSLLQFDSKSSLWDQRWFPEHNRCLRRALWTAGGKGSGPRRLVCPGCGIIFCKCAEMPFLLHWLWMQETATGLLQPIEWKKDKIFCGMKEVNTVTEGKQSRTKKQAENSFNLSDHRHFLLNADKLMLSRHFSTFAIVVLSVSMLTVATRHKQDNMICCCWYRLYGAAFFMIKHSSFCSPIHPLTHWLLHFATPHYFLFWTQMAGSARHLNDHA